MIGFLARFRDAGGVILVITLLLASLIYQCGRAT